MKLAPCMHKPPLKKLELMRIHFYSLLCLYCSLAAFGATLGQTISLPAGTVVQAIQLDASGNICIAGYAPPAKPRSANDLLDAFAAKLSPDGTEIIYWTVIGGSGSDQTTAMAVAPDGTLLIGGNTASSDFPTTQGSALPQPVPGDFEGFAVSIAPDGAVRYATYVGTSPSIANGISAWPPMRVPHT
jgi:hypothetical protein